MSMHVVIPNPPSINYPEEFCAVLGFVHVVLLRWSAVAVPALATLRQGKGQERMPCTALLELHWVTAASLEHLIAQHLIASHWSLLVSTSVLTAWLIAIMPSQQLFETQAWAAATAQLKFVDMVWCEWNFVLGHVGGRMQDASATKQT